MLKKIIYIIGFFLLLSNAAALLTGTTRAQPVGETDPCKPDARTFSELEECLPFSSSRILAKMHPGALEKNWSQLFASGNPETAGQDLYAAIYAMTAVKPEQQAAKNLSGHFGVTEAEMAQLLYGNINPILERKPLMSQEEAIEKIGEIQELYQEEKDILELRADIESSVSPAELFINGDLSDSGFDLVDDLSLLETILFNKAEPITVGGNFVLGGNVNDQNQSTQGLQPELTNQSGAAQNSQSGSGGGANAGGNSSASGSSSPMALMAGSSGTILSTPSENPNICFDTNPLGQALQEYEQEQNNAATTFKNSGSGPDLSGSGGGATTGSAASALNSSGGPLPNLSLQSAPVQAKSAPADNWLKEDECKDVFCLKVNFVKKPASLYQNTDNCIVCHLEKINAKIKETVSHSLVPGKVTGNLMEPQICKKAAITALSSIGMNFYTLSRPVQTPANDDLIYGAGLDEAFKSFLGTYKPFPIAELSPKPTKDGKGVEVAPSEAERAAKSAVALAGPATSLPEIQKSTDRELTTNAAAREAQALIAEQAVFSEVELGFYQGIRRELEQMNYFFTSFKDLLRSLHEEVEGISGEPACTSIKKKPVCE